MHKKNGFISMSLIYSFFMVFALISAVLLANYAHNRLLTKDFNTDIKTDLDERGDNKFINLGNKLQNSSFEADSIAGQDYQWIIIGASFETNQNYHSNRCISFNANSTTTTITQELVANTIKPNHKYYLQYYYFTGKQNVDFSSFKIYISNNADKTYYFQNLSNSYVTADNWKQVGYIITTPDDDNIAKNKKWYFTVTKNGNSVNPLYLDAFMLIDLTKSYGYNEEPSLNWLNNNLSYFEIRYIHDRKNYSKI